MTQSLSSQWPLMLGETLLTCSCYFAFPFVLFSESLVLEQVFCFSAPQRQSLARAVPHTVARVACAERESC